MWLGMHGLCNRYLAEVRGCVSVHACVCMCKRACASLVCVCVVGACQGSQAHPNAQECSGPWLRHLFHLAQVRGKDHGFWHQLDGVGSGLLPS